jgi:DNA repair exonuclease SbcCD ATPase subunit
MWRYDCGIRRLTRMIAMKFTKDDLDMNSLLNRVIATALIILAFVIVLLATSIFLYERLQRSINHNNAELLAEVDVLQETTGDLQDTIDVLNTITENDAQVADNLDFIDEQLDNMDESLDVIEQAIIEDTLAELDQIEAEAAIPPSIQEATEIRDNLNLIFVFITLLISGLSVFTAVTLAIVLNTRRKRRRVTLRDSL